MKLITARTGQAHITPFLDSMWHRGMTGNESGVFDAFENFEAEIVSNNDINIKSGVGMIQGRFFVTEVGTLDAVTIDNGSQGLNRTDLIVLRLTVNESADTQGAEYVVIKGESVEGSPTPPTPITGDLDTGALVADLPLYQVNIEGLNITSVTPIYSNIQLPITAGGTGAKTVENARQNINFIGINVLTSEDDNVATWQSLGTGLAYFGKAGSLVDQPSTYGFVLNLVTSNNVRQVWFTQVAGDIYTRGGNANGWSGSWVPLGGYVATRTNIASSYFNGSYVVKDGNVKQLILLNAKLAMTAGATYTIGTLPEGFRPALNINERVVIASSTSSTVTGAISITTDGVMKFTPFANRAAGDIVHINVMFI